MSAVVPPDATGTPAWRQAQRDHLAEICDTISQLDVDFHSDVPEFLDADRRKLLAIVSSFSYDVSTIPVEITSQIFVECLPADGRVRPSPHRAPLALAQICHRWREITLGTGQLWRSFDFTLQSALEARLEPSHAGICALHRAWCQRSNGYPLSLTLRCSTGRYNLPQGFIATIGKFASQWERMELALPDSLASPYTIAPFKARIGSSFPALSTLAFAMENLGSVMDERLGMFQNLPQLRDFRLFSGIALSHVPMGGAGLTSFELQAEVSLADCNTIFQVFPNLQHLGLWDIGFDSLTTPVPDPLPSLESLVLGFAGSDFLALVVLPHLRELAYQYAYPPLVRMLQTRRRTRGGGPRLSSFDLDFSSSHTMLPYDPDAEKLRRLVDDGLRLRIHGPGLEWPEGQFIAISNVYYLTDERIALRSRRKCAFEVDAEYLPDRVVRYSYLILVVQQRTNAEASAEVGRTAKKGTSVSKHTRLNGRRLERQESQAIRFCVEFTKEALVEGIFDLSKASLRTRHASAFRDKLESTRRLVNSDVRAGHIGEEDRKPSALGKLAYARCATRRRCSGAGTCGDLQTWV
ncbi:hypothetical protein B0H16DRAFT_1700394 [Mycena metata]|uniref:F-box domain-containing protein n=1 Tax=Mycena metata TaxID=1033252 RepID=A0AAD7MJG2_9AGAR|nr:hypothetical protein B0H16DRAFT_1700394 [Mycena metata]